MKKILLFFAAAVCAIASWAQTEASVSATVKGQQLEVALTNESEDFVAFQMDITLPTGVTVEAEGAVALVETRLTQPGTAASFDANQTVDFVIAYNKINETTVRVIAYNLANRAIAGKEGALFNVTFTGTAAANFELSNVKFVTLDQLKEVDLEDAQSSLGEDKLLGDVNMDKRVDVDDVIAAASIFLNNVTIPVDEDAADVNRDGKVDGDDIILIVNIYLGN